uniref:Thioredoxin s2 n=1 Tax=Medicago truncatula TaxID=3880 RepID=A9RAA6_MEDTR|nr:thioredoxin s2 [Medicago truncatula]
MATVTLAMSSFIILILFHTLSSSMATVQLESLPSYLLSAADASDGVAPVTDETFGSFVPMSKNLVLVEFYNPWCGQNCKNIHSIMVELANDYAGKVDFYKLNIDENPYITNRYVIQDLPTVVFIKYGMQRDRLVGDVPKATFIELIQLSI